MGMVGVWGPGDGGGAQFRGSGLGVVGLKGGKGSRGGRHWGNPVGMGVQGGEMGPCGRAWWRLQGVVGMAGSRGWWGGVYGVVGKMGRRGWWGWFRCGLCGGLGVDGNGGLRVGVFICHSKDQLPKPLAA